MRSFLSPTVGFAKERTVRVANRPFALLFYNKWLDSDDQHQFSNLSDSSTILTLSAPKLSQRSAGFQRKSNLQAKLYCHFDDCNKPEKKNGIAGDNGVLPPVLRRY